MSFSTDAKGGDGWRTYCSTELERLRGLLSISGGYGPMPPSDSALHLAQKIIGEIERSDLPLPFVVPGADGSIQVKWRKSNRELSFFVSDREVEFLTVEGKASKESKIISEGSIKGPSQLNEFVDWLLKA